ncbi:MAG: type II secretion system F family protein, partial [Rhodovibrionaceae bacterium]
MNALDGVFGTLDTVDVISAAVGFALLMLFVVIWYGLLERDPLPARIRMLGDRRRDLKSDLLRGGDQGHSTRRKRDSLMMMERMVTKLRLMKSKNAAAAKIKLTQAGWRSNQALTTFLFAKAVVPIFCALFAVGLFYGLKVGGFGKPMNAMLAIGSVLLGAFAPDIYVKNAIQKRQHAIRMALPDGFDLMVICAEAGLSLDSALERVSREMAGSCAQLSEEIGLTAVELSFLPDRHLALDNLAMRVPLPNMRALINTLIQTERYGT